MAVKVKKTTPARMGNVSSQATPTATVELPASNSNNSRDNGTVNIQDAKNQMNQLGVTAKTGVEGAKEAMTVAAMTPTWDAYFEDHPLTNVYSDRTAQNSSQQDFDIVSAAGIHEFRPEIIALTNFLPVYGNNSSQSSLNFDDPFADELTAAGKFLRLQFWSKSLIAENIKNLVTSLKANPATRDAVLKRESNFIEQIDVAKQDVDFLFSILLYLEKTKLALDLKANNEFLFADTDNSLKNFFVDKLGYLPADYWKASNSKIFLQLIYDLRQFLETHSYSLFGIGPARHGGEKFPFSVKREKPIPNSNFDFNKIKNDSKNLYNESYIKTFLSSLPSDSGDRLKVLVTVLTRELRISTFLGSGGGGFGPRGFVADGSQVEDGIGDPFGDIIGNIGNSVFDTPPSDGLSGLVRIVDGTNVILPFENKSIVTNADTAIPVYSPGTSFFLDSILKENPKFDTKRLKNYLTKLSDTIQNISITIGNALQLEKLGGTVKTPDLLPFGFMQRVIKIVRNSVKSVSSYEDFSEKNSFLLALFSSASKNTKIKSLLFRYVDLLVSYLTSDFGTALDSTEIKATTQR